MSEQDERDSGAQTTAGRKLAAIPSLRPGPRERALSRRRWAAAFGALAAALALIVVVAALFASHVHSTATATHTARNAATQTASARAKLAATALGQIVAISMDSPTDGWALGDATPQSQLSANGQENSPVQPVAALYHFDGRQWTLKQRVNGFSVQAIGPSSFKMFSATNGWAFGFSTDVLRYDGTAWRMEPINVAGGAQSFQIYAIDIISPTEGWAIANISPSGGNSGTGFLRFDGSQWTVEQRGIKLPTDLDPQGMQNTRITALPGGDVWVAANANITASIATAEAQQNAPNERGFLIHRVNGVWTVDDVAPLSGSAFSSLFNDIVMTSPTSGWVIGQTSKNATMIGGGTTSLTQPLLLRYDGRQWSEAQAPQDVRTNNELLTQVVANEPNDVWALVGTNGGSITNGVRVSAIFLHYDGATWTEVTASFPDTLTATTDISIDSIALGPDGTLWGMGMLAKERNNQGDFGPFIASYRDGAWSATTIATK